MTSYILLALGGIYLASMIFNYKKVPRYKRKYFHIFGVGLLLSVIMMILGILFPTETSSTFGIISGVAVAIIIFGLFGYSFYNVKKKVREMEKEKENQRHSD